MSKATAAITTCVVALALTAIVSTSASAMGWFVNGKELKSGENVALATKAVVDSPAVLNVPGLSLKITCSGVSETGAEIQGGTTMSQASSHIFEGCSEISPKTCKLITPTIATEPILGLLHLIIGALGFHIVYLLLHPRTGKTFTTLEFEGTCALAGAKPINGEVSVKGPTMTSEEVVQAVEGIGSTEGNNSLEVAGQKAFIEGGKALLKLVSGSKWSFHE